MLNYADFKNKGFFNMMMTFEKYHHEDNFNSNRTKMHNIADARYEAVNELRKGNVSCDIIQTIEQLDNERNGIEETLYKLAYSYYKQNQIA